MTRLWKSLVVLSLLLNGVSLVYLYAVLHPNPYSPQHYETEQIKLDLDMLKNEIQRLSLLQNETESIGGASCVPVR